ncbi:sensor histidine kinase [Plantactinospora sp. GCM10030261]|uniref:sensor histidine kinase n=1 Tax=Plantactinospora sp. GCM10030261 TaxID=3273420 RepID=UPI0036169B8F
MRSRLARLLMMIDGAIAAVVFGTVLLVVSTAPDGTRRPVEAALVVALAAVQAGTLLWFRRWPLRAMAVAVLAGVGLEILSPNLAWLGLIFVPLTYLARLRPPRVSLPVLIGLLLPTPVKLLTGDWRDALLAAVGLAFSWAVGELQRGQAHRRHEERRRIVATERERISRELHDVVAHHVAVIAVQAAGAQDVFDRRPDRARAALDTIQTSARSALAELRTMLNTLAPETADDEPAPAPQPRLAELDALAASVRAAGLRVTVRREGPDTILPDGVELSAYRIVQESLTNTLRHAHATRADVLLRYGPAALELEVVDDGALDGGGASGGWSAAAGGGHGLVGMRERARSVGGTLEAGPMPGGGFRVSAQLPVEGIS